MSAWPEFSARSSLQGERSDFFRNTFKVSRSIATQHTTIYETVMLHPAHGSKEVTSSSSDGAPSDVAIHNSREGIKGGKKMCKQCLQGVMTVINHNDGNDVEAGSSGMRHIPTAACSDKHQARPPMDHFMRLLEEAYPSHAYRIRHKLKDCSMMRSSMTSGSLT
jgi:hypothetical protein